MLPQLPGCPLATAKALRKAGKQVELAVYDDEIHGYALGATGIDFASRLERFFAKHLAAEATAPSEAPPE